MYGLDCRYRGYGFGSGKCGCPLGFGGAKCGCPCGFGGGKSGCPLGFGGAKCGCPCGFGDRKCGCPLGFGGGKSGCPLGFGGACGRRCPCLWIMACQAQCPWALNIFPGKHGGGAGGKGDFTVTLQVQEYSPVELEVKVVGKEVIVYGKQEAHPEQPGESSYVSREFTHRYPLGDDIDPDTVAASMNADKVLTITAKKRLAEGEPRVIDIKVASE